jgi:hypothetical protein
MGAPAAALGDPPAGLVAALKPDVNRIGECVAHVVGQVGAGRLGDDLWVPKTCGCRECHPRISRSQFVLVDETTELVGSA